MTEVSVKGRLTRILICAGVVFTALLTISGTALAEVDEKYFEALEYRLVGPFRGGRSTAVAGDVHNPLTFYMGATGGGVWVTHNAGQTWDNISDGQFNVGSIGAIAVAPSDPNVIYVGTGSAGIRGVSVSTGDGVYRSTDKGKTWKNVGLANSRTISAIVIHPANPDLLYVAVQGSSWGPTEERGIYRSKDGGETWENILYVNDTTGASDIVMDPANTRILYAGMWDHLRRPWEIRSGGEGSGLHKSTDGGDTWETINEGLPELIGKTGVSVSANPDRIYAIIEAEDKKGGLYRSENGGEDWTLINDDRRLYQRAWYYTHVFADPVDENTVYVLDAGASKSIDGGKSFESFAQDVHGDHHGLWINPGNTDFMINANDGGGTVTVDGGKTWSRQDNQPTAQFYRVNADHGYPYKIYGGQQDNSSVAIYSRGPDGGIGRDDYGSVGGCESAHVAFDPDNPRYVYAGCYLGLLSEYDQETGLTRGISLLPHIGAGVSPSERAYRFNWNAPIIVSSHDPNVIYYAGNVLFKSTDRAENWEVISPDLTRDDEAHQGPMGQPITNEVAEHYNTIFALVESPHDAGVLYVGSDDGLVNITRDGGATWQDITPRRLGEVMINSIEVSPHTPGTAYLVATGYKNNDHAPMIFKTTNYGARWTNISDGIPEHEFARVVREDTVRPGLLFAGTERGVHISFDGGKTWQPFQQNLPAVPVTDIKVNGNDLVLATQGRSFWVMDDISSLRAHNEAMEEANITLLDPADAAYFNTVGQVYRNPVQNPEDGVYIHFAINDVEAAGEMTLEILDESGDVIRTYLTEGEEETDFETFEAVEGMNRLVWDYSGEPVKPLEGYFNYANFSPSYLMPPGNYSVRLSYGEESQQQSFTVSDDPRSPIPGFMKGEQNELVLDLYKRIYELHENILDLQLVKAQVQEKLDLPDDIGMPGSVVEAGEDLIENIDAWIATLINKERTNFQDSLNWGDKYLDLLHWTYISFQSEVPPLNRNQVSEYHNLVGQWDDIVAGRDRIIAEDIVNFNALYSEKEIPALIMPGVLPEEPETDDTTKEETEESEDQ
ncbi:MAG: hypothetical protein IID52_02310 [Proteobacteria bacterium]|nr:hypothetical protein [Pseudomonadota bacterium]